MKTPVEGLTKSENLKLRDVLILLPTDEPVKLLELLFATKKGLNQTSPSNLRETAL